MPQGGVDYDIHPGERETIFWAHLVEVGEINAHSPFPTLLLHEDKIGQPLRVVHLSDETCFQ